MPLDLLAARLPMRSATVTATAVVVAVAQEGMRWQLQAQRYHLVGKPMLVHEGGLQVLQEHPDQRQAVQAVRATLRGHRPREEGRQLQDLERLQRVTLWAVQAAVQRRRPREGEQRLREVAPREALRLLPEEAEGRRRGKRQRRPLRRRRRGRAPAWRELTGGPEAAAVVLLVALARPGRWHPRRYPAAAVL